ncbi:MAG TPA: hypothetical protein VFE90_21700 [Myxococcales bacterium]|jgi:hypothetical protein|nr:hypothetical protein [Myxococcales bacterium]
MTLLLLLAAASFDLPSSRVTAEQVRSCRVDETLPLGGGIAEKRSCGPSMNAEAAQKKCKEAARHDGLPEGITADNCVAEYARGHFLFRGELKELIVARRRDGSAVAVFKVPEGEELAAFQHFADAVLVGIGGGRRFHYAVVSTRGILKAPNLGDPEEIRDVSVVGGRIRVTGRARAMFIDLVPGQHELRITR